MVWGIASRESAETVQRFVDQYGMTFPILLDTDERVNNTYAQEMAFPSAAYPQDWVIGTDGVVVYANIGFELDAMVAALERELAD